MRLDHHTTAGRARGAALVILLFASLFGCGAPKGAKVACGAALPSCPSSFICGEDGFCQFSIDNLDAGVPDAGERDLAGPDLQPGMAIVTPQTIRVPVGRNHYFKVSAGGAGAVTWSIGQPGGGSLAPIGAAPNDRDVEYIAPLSPGTYTVVADVATSPPARAVATVEVVAYGVELLAGETGGRGLADGIGNDSRTGSVFGMATDGTYLYFCDGHSIRRVTITTRSLETLAGAPLISGSADGIGGAARFNGPNGLTQYLGSLYISDSSNHTIRKLDLATNAVTTIAGGVGQPGAVDGIGAAARLNSPIGLAAEGGELFIADTGNHVIRKLTLSTGQVVRLAGTFGGTAMNNTSATELFSPVDVVATSAYLYVSEQAGHTVRRVDRATGTISLVAGAYNTPGFVQGDTSTARFNGPRGLALVANTLYVTDSTSVRVIDLLAVNTVTLFAGSATAGGVDGTGAAAALNNGYGMGFSSGFLYLADTSNSVVRQVTLTGAVTTFVGKLANRGSVDGTSTLARLSGPERLLIDGDDLYFGDAQSTVRKVNLSTRLVSTLAGTAGTITELDGTGAAALFRGVSGIAKVGAELYTVSRITKSVRRLTLATTAVTTLIPQNNALSGLSTPDLAIDANGAIYIASRTQLAKASTAGGVSVALGDTSSNLSGLAFLGSQLYATDRTRHVILRIELTTAPPTATVVAGGDGVAGYADGIGNTARFNSPISLVAGPDGLLYVTDLSNAVVRRVDPQTGAVTTLFGRAGVSIVRPGAVKDATLNAPWGIGVTADGEVVVSNLSEHCLSRLKRP